jgi:hypothetical protein
LVGWERSDRMGAKSDDGRRKVGGPGKRGKANIANS